MSRVQGVERTKWSVVLAEDDDDYAILVERALRRAADVSVEVLRARNGEEALSLLNEQVPDLLLLDLKMPGMTGHDALEQIKGDSRLRRIPVAVLTSSDLDEDVAMSYGLGGNHFITKPNDPEELERKLQALLRNVTELGTIRRGSTGASSTAISAVDPDAMAASTALRWTIVVGVLVALYLFGKFAGAF